MAVYYKFKSVKDYDSIAMDGPFISVGTLKEKIFELKHLGKGTDFDLEVTNAHTNEEYLDEAMLIPKNTLVIVRRVPGRPCLPIVTKSKVEDVIEEIEPKKSALQVANTSSMGFPNDSEWDDFGNDLYAIPETFPVQPINSIPDAPLITRAEEDIKIKALVDTPALDWHQFYNQGSYGFGASRGFGKGAGGRMGERGFGFQRKTPPQGYVCHRCKVSGHFIQHCPTNGDPNYDIKRVKPPTGIPKSMLMVTPDGSYALPSGALAVLRPNEAAFEKEIEGMPSTRSVGEFPPHLRCPMCKEVMKDVVFASKCCYESFCDKCIRDYIISKSACICGVTNILADDLLPNKRLRDTINDILDSGCNSSTNNANSEVSGNGDVSSLKSKYKFAPQTSGVEHNHNHQHSEKSPEPPCPQKRKSEHHDHVMVSDSYNDHYDHGHLRHHRQHSESLAASQIRAKSLATTSNSTVADHEHKMGVFSRIEFPEGETTKKRKLHSSSKDVLKSDLGYSIAHHKTTSNRYYDDYKTKIATVVS